MQTFFQMQNLGASPREMMLRELPANGIIVEIGGPVLNREPGTVHDSATINEDATKVGLMTCVCGQNDRRVSPCAEMSFWNAQSVSSTGRAC